jgi:Cys-tRNA(Pro)/Cys-tRNA(Cys) deacylase
VIDDSVRQLDVMYVSAGRRGLQVSLAPADLIRLTGATVAKIRT